MRRCATLLILGFLMQVGAVCDGVEHSEPALTLACRPDNDLFLALQESGISSARFSSATEAIARARPGSGVLLLADEYPKATVPVTSALFAEARAKDLRVYVEFPSQAPGLELGSAQPRPWHRLVIGSDRFGQDLPKGRILVAHECYVQPVAVTNAWVVSARVAGYDSAVFGIPAGAEPILWPVEMGRVLVSTTKLSGFITGRFAPQREWRALWNHVLSQLTQTTLPALRWRPRVQTAYRPDESLPLDVEMTTVRKAAEWCSQSGLLVWESRVPEVLAMLRVDQALTNRPMASEELGDGRYGILEGYGSNIRPDGEQPQRVPIRADCQAESAMVLALDWALNANATSRNVASNLLDYLYFTSDLCQGPRGNPRHPAFGLISWGSTSPPWLIANYGDDNARTMLATILAAACLNSPRWNQPLLRALLANLRTTGRDGFRGDRIDMPELEKNGWRYYHDRSLVNCSPPFEAYNWACFLWAYRQTGEREFMERTKRGIRMTMEAFPEKWRWNDNSERARMLLCLAWLARLEDTAEHRAWIQRVARDLIDIQDQTGAIPERFRGAVGSHYQIPQSNEAYGTGETPLLQENGDPVSDQLYVTGFALLALHEAAAVLADPRIRAAEDQLAQFLCRIQIRSTSLPYLEGAWFRAFDFKRWEPWASSGDAGWGAWCLESGWGPAWTAAVLGLRQRNRSFWEFAAASRIGEHLTAVRDEMGENQGEPWAKSRTPSEAP
ncbi:MAG: hypothetical protein U1G07_07360 [Verrucomicrobiota bacterium]